jgi:hypothetical protein
MITAAERLFPVRIRIGVPPGGLGEADFENTLGDNRLNTA